jgi:xylulokinase
MLSLGIDLGTDGVRVEAVDEGGAPVTHASAPYPTSTPQPGWTEQRPEDWWQATVTATQAVTRALGARAKEIKSVGLTGPRGSVFLDEAFQAIRPAILGTDQRATAEAAEITQLIGPANAGAMAAQILWLRRHEPTHYARLQLVVQPKDYIRFRMTGIFATDLSDAPGTLLCDRTERRWSHEICEALEIPLTWLPSVKEPTEVTGQVIPGIWALTGIPSWTSVTAGRC